MDKPLDELARELIGLAEKATPGEWFNAGPFGVRSGKSNDCGETTQVCAQATDDDKHFIATAKNTAPAISRAYLEALGEIRRLKAQLSDNLHSTPCEQIRRHYGENQ